MAESPGKQISDKKQLTASGAEVIFLVLLVAFGMGLCVWVERAFASVFNEPTEQRAFDTPRIKEKQEQLTRLETAIKETEKQVDVVALDQLKQAAAIRSFETLHPELARPRQGATTSVSTEVEKNYEAAKTQQMAADEYARLLNDRITSLKTDAEKTIQALATEKQMATDKLRGQRRTYLTLKFATSFVLPLVFVLIALFVGAGLLNRVAGRQVWTSRGWRPVLLVAGALLILLAYQAFEIAGAVLIGMILFLILLRKINWSPKVGEKGTE